MQHPQQLSDEDLELLSAYIDNQILAAERRALEERLDREPALRTALEELRTMVGLLHDLPALTPPRSFTIAPSAVQPRWFASVFWLRFGSALSAILLALTITFDLARVGTASLKVAPESQPFTSQQAPAPAGSLSATESAGAAGGAAAGAAPAANAPPTPTAEASIATPAIKQKAAAAAPVEQATSENSASASDQANQVAPNNPQQEATQAITSSSSASSGTTQLARPQVAPQTRSSSGSTIQSIRLVEFSLGALTVLFGLGAFFVARRRRS